MFRFSTPKHIFKFPSGIAPEDLTAAYVTYQQNGQTVLEKTLDDLTFEDDRFSCRLTQEETGAFSTRYPAKIQVRLLFSNDNSFPSFVFEVPVKDVLKKGVIGDA